MIFISILLHAVCCVQWRAPARVKYKNFLLSRFPVSSFRSCPFLFNRFSAKTKNDWNSRKNFKKVFGKYDLIELDYAAKVLFVYNFP